MNISPDEVRTDIADEEVSDKVFTIPNLISFIRLCLIPAYVILLFAGYDAAATVVFAVAACSDFVDGQVARRTHSVSKLGQLLDPAVDRLLMVSVVIVLLIVARLPVWVVALVLLRDLGLLLAGAFLLKRYRVRIPVIYLGKVATTFLFLGCFGLLLNAPLVPGLAICDLSWLPGFTDQAVSWGIWCVYLGLVLALITTAHYVVQGYAGYRAAKENAPSDEVC